MHFDKQDNFGYQFFSFLFFFNIVSISTIVAELNYFFFVFFLFKFCFEIATNTAIITLFIQELRKYSCKMVSDPTRLDVNDGQLDQYSELASWYKAS